MLYKQQGKKKYNILLLENMNTKNIILTILAVALTSSQIITASAQCCTDNTIQASGQGKASALPDMASIQLRFSEKGQTSVVAVQALSKKVNQAISILNANGYNSSSYSTGTLNVFPQYNYLNGKSQVVGQQATQSLTITVLGLDSKGQKVGTLVDALSQVNGINIDSVSFDVFNKTSLQNQARTAAFNNAKSKASDYATFAGLNLGRVLKIDDTTTVSAPAQPVAFKAAMVLDSAAGSPTQVPLGNLDVSYYTVVTFGLQ